MNQSPFTLDEIVRLTRGTVLMASGMARRPRWYRLDSREVEAGDLFVAVKGERADGADFIPEVALKGAVAVLTERAMAGVSIVQVLVPNVRDALQTLGAEHRRGIEVPVVAVTGSNGKTTTKNLITQVLSRSLRTACSEGNFNSQLGLPLCVLNNLTADHQVAIYEVGMSARGEIDRLARMIGPSMGVVTNVGPAHLESLGSLDAIYEAKSELIDVLPRDGLVVLNAEDAYGARMRQRFPGRAVMVSQGGGSPLVPGTIGESIRLEVIRSDLDGTRGHLFMGAERHDFHLPLLGRHLAYAGMMAIAVGRELGISTPAILAALAACKPTPHRMELRPGRVLILDDCYNANPSSMKASLAFLQEVPHPGRKVAILGDMLELGESGPAAHREIIATLRALPLAQVHLVGPQFAVAGSADRSAASRLHFHESTDALTRILAASVAPGDLVLLKGSRGIHLERVIPLLGIGM